jgi:HD-GYP domain-containing protein (c-di-GMP phosphodiesterase class II)
MSAVRADAGETLAPLEEQLMENTREAQAVRLDRREALAEAGVGAGFVLAAAVLAVAAPWERPLTAATAALLVALYAAASRVRLEIGAGYTVPTQLVFVPMLYFLPPAVVPLAVAAGILAGNLPDYLRRRRHASRAVLALGDSWHALGPALVFVIAAPGGPDTGDWPLLAAALGAQFAVDFAASTVREWAGRGIAPAIQPRLLAWVYLGDAALTPLGLFAALVAADEPLTLLLLLPVAGLLAVYSAERRGHITAALELSRAYRGTARLLGEVLEADDAYTGSHSRSVLDLSLQVADLIGLDARERRQVEFAALLHDIGKIAIPKAIVNKPGALDGEEWEVMRTHTILGQDMLDRVGGWLSEVGRAVRASHERFDGHGYPDGLAGHEIPLAARIVACCDAFNAMTTARPYRMPMSADVAIRELLANSGTQFDPRVVRKLIPLVRPRPGRSADGLPALRRDAGLARPPA